MAARTSVARAAGTTADLSPLMRLGLGTTTFLGALLLFQVQPLVGKAALPWFGGSPAVWTTGLMMFQTLLVVGYAAVFLASRYLGPRARSWGFILVAGLSLAALELPPDPAWKPAAGDDPVGRLASLVVVSVGAAYVVLAMTGPLVQEWFARASHGRSPYRLYALSNLGSLAGLLAYPLVIEPTFDLTTQGRLWTGTFWSYVAVASACAWRAGTFAELPAAGARAGDEAPPTWRDALVWLALAAAGTLLLSATTNHVCQDVGATPLLWVMPLALYLVTLILSFERPHWYRRRWCAAAVMLTVPTAVWLDRQSHHIIGPNLVLLFFGCWLCHGELAARRPPPRYLTAYFLLIALGGALGGLFVGIVAPLVFARYWEWPLAIAGLLSAGALLVARGAFDAWNGRRPAFETPRRRRLQAALTMLAATAGVPIVAEEVWRQKRAHEVESIRNFYGVVSVAVTQSDIYRRTALNNGSTLHGSQLIANEQEKTVPDTYYGYRSGVGRLLNDPQAVAAPRRVGVVGLGAGTLAAYGKGADLFRFYEINPAVVDLAGRYFTYLRNCPATCETVLGDARLSLEAEPHQAFDVLVLDAFTSDSIPWHLLTLEAFEIYLPHLADDGVIALHLTNRHLNLLPVAGGAARRFGLTGGVFDSAEDVRDGTKTARWVLLTRRPDSPLWRNLQAAMSGPLPAAENLRPWTDGFSSWWSLTE